jgi:hypothetical protein
MVHYQIKLASTFDNCYDMTGLVKTKNKEEK